MPFKKKKKRRTKHIADSALKKKLDSCPEFVNLLQFHWEKSGQSQRTIKINSEWTTTECIALSRNIYTARKFECTTRALSSKIEQRLFVFFKFRNEEACIAKAAR